jgi:hypothetical protein
VIAEDGQFDVTGYTVQYELLRSQVIGPLGNTTAEPPRGLGLALFLSEEMPGWLQNVAVVLGPRAADSATWDPSSQPSVVAERLPATQRQEITSILASLILSTLPAGHQSSREGYR